jgi:hypothetical protein
MVKPIPVNVKRALGCAGAWLCIEFMSWAYLGLWRSPYYSWGPSSNLVLPFLDIKIDTWSKWSLLMFHTSISVSVAVYSADLFYPWMSSVALNPGVKLRHDKKHVWMLVNLFWIIASVHALLFFMLVYSQIDVALVSAASAAVTGLFSSYFVIYDKKRDEEAGIAIFTNEFIDLT